MKLPKLHRVVNITFSSLRNGIGSGLGVIYDVDTDVSRKARRVLCEGGWKWQVKRFRYDWMDDWCIETDQECLDEIGMDMQWVEINKRGEV